MDDKNTEPKPVFTARKRFFRKRWFIIVAILVLLFFSGVIGGWWYITNKKTSPATKLTEAMAENVEKTLIDARKLDFAGSTDDAMALYDDAINKAENSYQKSILLTGKAASYFDDGNIDGALTIALEADAANQNDTVSYFIAQIYEKKGDNQKAVEYYQKAILFIDKSSPVADADVQYFQSKIDELSVE